MTNKKASRLFLVALGIYLIYKIALDLRNDFMPNVKIFFPESILIFLIFIALLFVHRYGMRDGKPIGQQAGYTEGWEAARKAELFSYDNKADGLPDGFFYHLLWSKNTTAGDILNAVERISGHDTGLPRYYLVSSSTTRPLPTNFTMKNRTAHKYVPGGNSEH